MAKAKNTKLSGAKKIRRKASAVGKLGGKRTIRKQLRARPTGVARKRPAALPKASTKPWGEAGKALEGIRILDFTHVQSGPSCTQLLAWFGADVIKLERPGGGDITRGQLRDVPDVDSLYFTMLNHNKRSITLDSKHPKGKEVLERLVKACDVLVENFAPGALERMGLSFEAIHKLNPRIIVASVKGFGPGPYEACKVYENVAQCTGGAASTTGFLDGPPVVTGAQIGDTGTGLHLALGIVCALYQRHRTGRGQKVFAAMQDGVLNLCRVKLRDQQRLKHGPLSEYSQHGQGIPFGEAVPRAGNDSGGGQPGWILKCKGWETDPNAYIYFITQAPVWPAICEVIGEPCWKTDPDYATPNGRLPRLKAVFDRIEQWTKTKSKLEAMAILNQYDIPCGPILSMKELAEDESLRHTGTVVEVEHPTRGKYLTVGNPIKLTDSISEVKRAPLLGEHTEEILTEVLGFSAREVAEIKQSGALSTAPARAVAA
jgi:formyl-CoA transferase